MKNNIRNIAIVAHVDHGKTTLIDSIMKQTGLWRDNQKIEERVMDSGDLEKERGITILSKPASIKWKETRINIIDTPGHSDFSSEVERVLDMADGVILLTDAAEGCLPGTSFVMKKALAQGLKPIVIINKIDRKDARPKEVIDEVFDLFVALGATDEQLDFPILYASGRDGWSVKELSEPKENLHSLLDLMLQHVPAPKVEMDKPFAMLSTLLYADNFLGRCLVGRIGQGTARINQNVKAINLDGKKVDAGRLTKLLRFEGTKKIPVEEVVAGDIVIIAGLTKATVADTICDLSVEKPLPSTPIDPPTMSISISVNSSPLAGKEGTKLTSTKIRERLLAEDENNVGITFSENENKDYFEISGRGELQLGVLVETMRREGFELTVSRPRVIFKTDTNGNKTEPIEEVVIDLDTEFSSKIIDSMNRRKAEMINMIDTGAGKTRLIFHAPSRGLIGYQSRFMTQTRGTGVMNRTFHSYGLFKPGITGRINGALISMETGSAVAFAIFNLQERGEIFIGHNTEVYEGMICGEHNRNNDLEVNFLKGKKLTNMRTQGTDENIVLTPPRQMSLEEKMAYINDDEVLEVTPKHLRLRKKYLDHHERKRMSKNNSQNI
jgi:GTP-binding protein